MAEISLENEQFIDEMVTSGRFKSRQDAINEAVWLLRSEIQRNGDGPSDEPTAHEWCERFEAWAASHRDLPYEADDSRDTIYAGRGE